MATASPVITHVAYDGAKLSLTWRYLVAGSTAFVITLTVNGQAKTWTKTSSTPLVSFTTAVAIAPTDAAVVTVTVPTVGATSNSPMVIAAKPTLVWLINNGDSASVTWTPAKPLGAIKYVAILTAGSTLLNAEVPGTATSVNFPSLPSLTTPAQVVVRASSMDDISLGPTTVSATLLTTGCTTTGATDDGLSVKLDWTPDGTAGQWLATLYAPGNSWNVEVPANSTSAVFERVLTGPGPFSALVRATSADSVSLGPPSAACIPVLTRARPGALARFLADAGYAAPETAHAVGSQFTTATATQMGQILIDGFGTMSEAVLRQSLAACAYAVADIDSAVATATASGGLHG